MEFIFVELALLYNNLTLTQLFRTYYNKGSHHTFNHKHDSQINQAVLFILRTAANLIIATPLLCALIGHHSSI